MDLERQPLLGNTSDVRCRRSRPLTSEEVLAARQDITWRRTRFCILVMFWSLMVMFISIITYLLFTASGCNSYEKSLVQAPTVPPIHMTLAPLIYRINDDKVFTL
ncbi:unnamed protein product [Arctia plantaginis]|uniref:Solute carrier family 3 member 2 N-terminal domain-containing protein n=1 Tax=Arctia plantaginis TaxID=874455 RepID=A0A8S1AUZ6_ARCPL|nr:unnamed protein product [Arctia plantaginis]CAB3249426.1 unnamed protein product [Arctia plantaginis]